MLSIDDYFGAKINCEEVTLAMRARAEEVLLPRVNRILDAAYEAGAYDNAVDPDTGTQISGARGGVGDGGFRLSNSHTGAVNSKHKQAQAVDIFDPANVLDDWLNDALLTEFGLYREHPDSTRGWCHLQSVAPKSGKRTFKP